MTAPCKRCEHLKGCKYPYNPCISGRYDCFTVMKSPKKAHLNCYVECALIEVDFETYMAKVEIPKSIMKKGFHAGNLKIDFGGVQD